MQVVPHDTITEINEFVVSVSPKGQITMPKAIRNKLGVKPKDKVVIRLEEGEVRVVPVNVTFETIYQSVPPLKKKLTDKEITQIAWEDQTPRTAKKGI